MNLFLELMQEEMQGSADSIRLPLPESDACRKLVGYIESKYNAKISLDHFCSVLPYSSRHISRLFIRELKMTLFEYLRVYRMIHASVALHSKEKSVLEVSLDCGYDSLSLFYSDFMRTFSVTPADFRKNVSALKSSDRNPR